MLIGVFLCAQWSSVFLFLVIEWAIIVYYKFGTFENPESIFGKFTNFFMNFFTGSDYFLYSKFSKLKWIIKEFYMLITLILHGVLSIILYYLITIPLDLIFL
jgi:hypothetical protein